jgi:hypothetical protein
LAVLWIGLKVDGLSSFLLYSNARRLNRQCLLLGSKSCLVPLCLNRKGRLEPRCKESRVAITALCVLIVWPCATVF